MSKKGVILRIALAILILVNVLVLVFMFGTSRMLTVAFLDVGQGDAIFIQSPTGRQILIDGGRDRSVLRELGKRMSPFDRSIDVVVATHPDADHIAGLADVFERYRIGAYLSPGMPNDTSQTKALENAVMHETGVKSVLARRGMRVDLGRGVYLDIVFPDRDVSGLETNTGSIVARLVYGETSFLLTADSPIAIENYLLSLGSKELESNVLKAGHHGSRTSTGQEYLEAVDPDFVVISAGKGNSYGHPHAEVVDRIKTYDATQLGTLGEGAVVFESDGQTLTVKH